ncbi:MAG: hypothetical protein HY646_18930 [Acidobacteria bacterium]|nr:hypothetical protein [Acidobacteriota bacterium]
MYRSIVSLVLTCGLLAGLAMAHGGAVHLAGTIAAIENDHLTLKTTDGKTVSVMIGAKTKYLKAKTAVTKADITVGSRVVVDVTMDEKMKMYTASEVTLGTAASTAKPAATPAAKKSGAADTHKEHK